MSGNLRLSAKHGVNPALGVCFVCGKDDGTVVLCGRLPGDAEAPRRVVTGHLCPSCENLRRTAYIIAEAINDPAIQHPRTTGRYIAVTLAGVTALFGNTPTGLALTRQHLAFAEPEVFAKILARVGLETSSAAVQARETAYDPCGVPRNDETA